MIRHRGMRLIAALVAGLIVAFLAGLLLLSGARPAAEAPAPAPEAENVPPLPVPLPAQPPPAETPKNAAPPPEGDDPSSLTSPDDTVVEGTAVLEDGSPFKGVLFLEMVPAEGGGWEVDLDADAPVDRSAVPNAFQFRWKEPRAEVFLLVLGRTAECVAAEGAELVGLEERGEVVRFTPGVPARLVFRGLPGRRVRLHLEGTRGLDSLRASPPAVRILDANGNPSPQEGASCGWSEGLPGAEDRDLSVQVEFPVLTRSEREAGDRRIAELRIPFFEPVRIPLVELEDGLRLSPVPLAPSVRGVLSPPPSPGAPTVFTVAFKGATGQIHPDLAAAERRLDPDGTILLYDLPEGEFALHVMRRTPEGLRWGRRVFRKGPDPLDLGVVEADGYAGLRVRLLDEEGKPVLAASLSVTRVEEGEFGRTAALQVEERPGPRGGQILLRPDYLRIQPGTGERDPEGWYEIPDLAPGTRYRVQDRERGGPAAEVTTPAGNGEWTELELRRKPAEEGK